jgi:hypothetical protein
MQRVGAGATRHVEQPFGVEVSTWILAERFGLVGAPHVERAAIGLRIDGDARNAELAQRPRDADGDFAAIGDQKLAKRHGRLET